MSFILHESVIFLSGIKLAVQKFDTHCCHMGTARASCARPG